jgi:3-phosphoshikimate 1-carboxyvinyltransferase
VTTLVIHPAGQPLKGSVPVPSDKSIGHRALLFAALCEGTSDIHAFSHGEDNVSTANALRAMGVRIEEAGPSDLRVHGAGLFGLMAPEVALDCGNSAGSSRRSPSGARSSATRRSRAAR